MLFSACNTEPIGVEAELIQTDVPEEMATTIGVPWLIQAESMVRFYGATPTHGQTGECSIDSGVLYLQNDLITAGFALFNLRDIRITSPDLDEEKKQQFRSHLLSKDFFHEQEYPTIKFGITNIEPQSAENAAEYKVTGKLSMHGKTNLIRFPANITNTDSVIQAKATFIINRKDWGMSYKNNRSLGDEWIYDKVELKISLTAKKERIESDLVDKKS